MENGNGHAGPPRRQHLAGIPPPTPPIIVVANPVSNGVVLRPTRITLTAIKIIGRGSFGEVILARLHETNGTVAVKKVKESRHHVHRELAIIRTLNHPNIITLHLYYHSLDFKTGDRYLHLIMERMPESLGSLLKRFWDNNELLPFLYVKIFGYQMFLGLEYLHSLGICHRDIKPHNLLVDVEFGILKICDFGCAKELVQGGESLSYICSRNYRAPELIFGSVHYSVKIDIWSAGCVFGEMLTGKVLFRGVSHELQGLEILFVLGVPTREEVHEMNPDFLFYDVLPRIAPTPWEDVLPPGTPAAAIDVVSRLLRYGASSRPHAGEISQHQFFDEMRIQAPARLPMLQPLPPLGHAGPMNGNNGNIAGGSSSSSGHQR